MASIDKTYEIGENGEYVQVFAGYTDDFQQEAYFTVLLKDRDDNVITMGERRCSWVINEDNQMEIEFTSYGNYKKDFWGLYYTAIHQEFNKGDILILSMISI